MGRFFLMLFLYIFCFIVNIGCFSLKPAAEKSGKNLFETFYVGEEGLQYFIKPLFLENNEHKQKVFIDYTFRYKNKVTLQDSVITNISIIGQYSLLNKVNYISLNNSKCKVSLNNIKLLFNEKHKDYYSQRLTSKISLLELQQFFSDNDWYINIQSEKVEMRYTTTSRTKKRIKNINDYVINILNY